MLRAAKAPWLARSSDRCRREIVCCNRSSSAGAIFSPSLPARVGGSSSQLGQKDSTRDGKRREKRSGKSHARPCDSRAHRRHASFGPSSSSAPVGSDTVAVSDVRDGCCQGCLSLKADSDAAAAACPSADYGCARPQQLCRKQTQLKGLSQLQVLSFVISMG